MLHYLRPCALIPALALGAAAAALSAADPVSPYAGQQQRAIKALSAQEVDDYLNGRGMGYARAAELNHYPGPRHVLELAGELALSGAQRRQTEALFARMQAAAIGLGRELVAREADLDRLFAAGDVDASRLEQLLHQIGALHSRLRYQHLHAHLEQRALLTHHQIQRYDALRGYAAGAGGHDHGGQERVH